MTESAFDFDKFVIEERLNDYVVGLTEVLDGDLAELPQRLQLFRQKCSIPEPQQDAQLFEFELCTRSSETIPAEAAAQNVNLQLVTMLVNDRYFVSRDYLVGPAQEWLEIAHPPSANLQEEASTLSYLDKDKKVVNWTLTMNNLKRLCKNHLYSESMMLSCLLRFVSQFLPSETVYLKNCTANELARFLISLDSITDLKFLYKKRLLESCRQVNESLSKSVHKVENLISCIFEYPRRAAAQAQPGAGVDGQLGEPAVGVPPIEFEPNSLENRILITSIISFIDNRLALPMLKKVQAENLANKLLNFREYLEIAQRAEIASNFFPTTVLQYGRHVSSTFPYVDLNQLDVSAEDASYCLLVPVPRTPDVLTLIPDQDQLFYNISVPQSVNVSSVQSENRSFEPMLEKVPDIVVHDQPDDHVMLNNSCVPDDLVELKSSCRQEKKALVSAFLHDALKNAVEYLLMFKNEQSRDHECGDHPPRKRSRTQSYDVSDHHSYRERHSTPFYHDNDQHFSRERDRYQSYDGSDHYPHKGKDRTPSFDDREHHRKHFRRCEISRERSHRDDDFRYPNLKGL